MTGRFATEYTQRQEREREEDKRLNKLEQDRHHHPYNVSKKETGVTRVHSLLFEFEFERTWSKNRASRDTSWLWIESGKWVLSSFAEDRLPCSRKCFIHLSPVVSTKRNVSWIKLCMSCITTCLLLSWEDEGNERRSSCWVVSLFLHQTKHYIPCKPHVQLIM